MIKRLLLFCSGCDTEIISKCPATEVNKYVGIGGSVLATTVFATISSGYAMYQVFNTEPYAFVYAFIFAIIWGLMIFNLDRFIVGSMQKSKNLLMEILSALPRVAIAIVISLVITKPLEVRIFSSRIVDEMDHQRIQSTENKANRIKAINGVPEMEKIFEGIAVDYQIAIDRSKGEPSGQDYINLKEQAAAAQTKLSNLRKQLDPKINNLSTQYSSLWDNPSLYTIQDGKRVFAPDIHERMNRIKNELDSYKSQISAAKSNASSLSSKVATKLKAYQAQERERADNLNAHRERAREKLDSARTRTADEVVVSGEKSKIGFSNNFISQIDALGSLTAWKNDKYDDRGQVIERATNTMYYTDRFLMLLFLLVEIAPIITKLMSKKGVYDELLAAEEQLHKESIKLDLDTQLDMLKKNNEQVIEIDLQNNKTLKAAILSAQIEIAEKVVSNWKREQLEKLN